MSTLLNLINGLLDPDNAADNVVDDAGDMLPVANPDRYIPPTSMADLPHAAAEPTYTIDMSWKPFPDFGEPTISGQAIAESTIAHIEQIVNNRSPEIIADGNRIADGIMAHIDDVMNDPENQRAGNKLVDDLMKGSLGDKW